MPTISGGRSPAPQAWKARETLFRRSEEETAGVAEAGAASSSLGNRVSRALHRDGRRLSQDTQGRPGPVRMRVFVQKTGSSRCPGCTALPYAPEGTRGRMPAGCYTSNQLWRRLLVKKPDGRVSARQNELRLLKSLHKYGWLRTRDLAAIHWMPRQPRAKHYQPVSIAVSETAQRMAQRTLARLRNQRLVIWMQAPDGSLIYGVSEAGARKLVDLGIPAKSGKNQVRRVSLSHYHHRRIANEVAIVAGLQGYRVSSETEIACGTWLGGNTGVKGKKPDFLVREGQSVYWGEVERSRRRQSDYRKLVACRSCSGMTTLNGTMSHRRQKPFDWSVTEGK